MTLTIKVTCADDAQFWDETAGAQTPAEFLTDVLQTAQADLRFDFQIDDGPVITPETPFSQSPPPTQRPVVPYDDLDDGDE